MRLIDADALIDTMAIIAKKFAKTDAQKALMGRVMYIIEHKAEDVVRCKDCKHLETVIDIIGDMYCFCGNADGKHITEVDLDDFCSHAEKREGAENG
jgi:hypothetical protein